MEVVNQGQSREEYFNTQIKRSRQKFEYCKVSASDTLRYAKALESAGRSLTEGPVLCLGTRNGREIDLFRLTAQRPLLAKLFAKTELERKGFSSPFDFMLRILSPSSDLAQMDARSTLGVEINPDAARQDVWIGSFDEMPKEWEHRFGVIYSNSFDQSQDPHRTAAEWLRIARPGAILIFAFTQGARPSDRDPVGDLHFADVKNLFPGKVLYQTPAGERTNYQELIIELPGAAAR